MPGLADFQEAFARALRSGDAGPLAPWTQERGDVLAGRLGIYRNNVYHGLCEALGAAYPVVRRLVGGEFFTAMARAWLERNLPRRASLVDYGAGFADFVAGFAPVRHLPWLADVARLERAWLEAHHAAEARSLTPADFAGVPPERFADMTLALHPSAQVVCLAFPAHRIWEANREEKPPPLTIVPARTALLVVRPRWRVEVSVLAPGAPDLLAALAAGGDLAEAAARAGDLAPGFDLQAALHDLLTGGVFTGFALASEGARTAEGAASGASPPPGAAVHGSRPAPGRSEKENTP